MTPAAPKDAATVVVLRDTEDRFEVFLVRRHGKSGFMAGAHVFPGGKLDDEDADPRLGARLAGRTPGDCARALGEDDVAKSAALFVAGVRETFEEAGVLVADGFEADERDAARKALHEGGSFVRLAEELDLTLRLDRLVPQARWITPTVEPRRYDTRFFLARVGTNVDASHDAIETTAGEWMTPDAALVKERAGEISLPPPTMHTLTWLSRFETAQAALDDAATRTPPTVQPEFRDVAGSFVLALPGDPLHSVAEPAFDGATRFVLEKGRWWARRADG